MVTIWEMQTNFWQFSIYVIFVKNMEMVVWNVKKLVLIGNWKGFGALFFVFFEMVDGYNLNKVSWFLGVWILIICVIAIVKTLNMLISIVNKLVLTRIWNMTWCYVFSIRWKMVVIQAMQTSFWEWKCVITIVKVEDGGFKHIHLCETTSICLELWRFYWFSITYFYDLFR
jgi:hypothetical protein